MSQNISSQSGEWGTILDKRKRRHKYLSLRWILVLTYMCIGFLPILIFANTVFSTIDKYFLEERQKELLSQANIIAGHISISDYLFDEEKNLLFDYDILETSQDGNYRIIVTDATGKVVNDSVHDKEKSYVGKIFLIPEIIEALDNNDVARVQTNGTIYAAASIVYSSSQKVGAVLIVSMPEDLSVTLEGIKKQIYFLMIGIIIIVGIIIIALSQIFTEPLKRILAAIKKMSEGHFDQRVQINTPYKNEITDLTETCNTMAEKLEQVETTRQLFVSNVSHELKTPLSSIKVLSESILLQEDGPKEMYIEFLRDINSEVDRMTDIINDLLSLVRLDQKDIPLKFTESNLNQVIDELMKRLEPLAHKKNISLEVNHLKEVTMDMDKTKLMLAISNLIENGIKYTQADGRVSVTVDADHQNVFITVADTGVGIAEDELGKIFDRFYRVDKTRDRETGGTGLGLAITHSTVLIHNGTIRVSSRENEGTTFVVKLPLHQNL